MSVPEPRLCELDRYAREALARLLRAREEKTRVEEDEQKARDQLLGFLTSHDATGGTIAGTQVVALIRYARETVDVRRLKAEEPFMWRRFGRMGMVERLDVLRRAVPSDVEGGA